MSERADWVNGRSKCDIEHCMKEIREAVESDIAEMNRLHPTDADAPDRFTIDEQISWLVVENAPYSRVIAHRLFEAEATCIQIREPYSQDVLFTVRTKWCRSRHECVYSLISDQKEEELVPWQISERALYPIFFPGDQ